MAEPAGAPVRAPSPAGAPVREPGPAGAAGSSGVPGLTSFVVIAFNAARTIRRAVGSIQALDGLGEHEILVVNDGSRDDTAAVVARLATADPAVRLVDLGRNRGRGFARAAGVDAARGELIAQVDADLELPRDWLVRTRAALGDHDAVGGIMVPDGDVAYLFSRFRLQPKAHRPTVPVTGGTGLYRRAVFDQVQFDRGLRDGEDVALNHAMQARGLRLATLDDLLCRHGEAKSFAESVRWLYLSGKGASRQLRRYRKLRQPDLAWAGFVGTVLAGLVLAARRRPAGIALPAGYLLASSLGHVGTRFAPVPGDGARYAGAVLTDAVLLFAYYLGRFAGLWPGEQTGPAGDR